MIVEGDTNSVEDWEVLETTWTITGDFVGDRVGNETTRIVGGSTTGVTEAVILRKRVVLEE